MEFLFVFMWTWKFWHQKWARKGKRGKKNIEPNQLGLSNTLTASLQRGKTPTPNECPRYDTKLSDGEAPVMLELWGIWSTPSLPSLLGPLWPGLVTPDWVLSLGQIELFGI